MSRQPVIILGAPRSGTTILGKLLSSHHDIHYMEEPSPLWKRYPKLSGDFVGNNYTQREVDKTRALFDESLKESGKSRLIEKTPQNCLRLPFVYSVFPEAKFVHIIRDGYESSLSIMKYWETTSDVKGVKVGQRLKEASLGQIPGYAWQYFKRMTAKKGGKPPVFWGPVLPGMGEIVNHFEVAEVAALQWKSCVEQAVSHGRKIPPNQYFELRLENLNESTLQQVLEFAVMQNVDSVIERYRAEFRPDDAAYRKKQADPAVVELIKPWVEPTQVWLNSLKG